MLRPNEFKAALRFRRIARGKVMSARIVTEEHKSVTEIDIVLDGPPSHEAGRFVEIEHALHGHSMNVGQWVERDDGYWVIRLRVCDEDIHGENRGRL